MLLKYDMPRGTGKTASLIHLCVKIGARLVVHTHQCVGTAKQMAHQLGYKNFKEPITFQELMNSRKHGLRHDEKFIVDELDICLAQHGIVGYSNSSDNPLLTEQLHKWQVKEYQRQTGKKTMQLSDIRITRAFSSTMPKSHKMAQCYDYYCEHGRLDRDIVIDSNDYLKDGYVAYLVCKMLGKESVDVKVA